MASGGTQEPARGIVLSLPARATPRLKLGAVLVLLLVAAGVAVLVSALGSHGSESPTQSIRSSVTGTEDLPAPDLEPTIYVHLLGAVAHPGLYELPEGARMIDAVAAAGGYTKKADRSSLNLARFLSDGEQVYAPELGEDPLPGTVGPVGAPGGKVNLNTADAALLETLPRVGPATAARIIAWREVNGRFTSIDELMSVSGIGEKTFAELSELVTV